MTDAYKAYLRKYCNCKGPVCTVEEELQNFKEQLEALEADLQKCGGEEEHEG